MQVTMSRAVITTYAFTVAALLCPECLSAMFSTPTEEQLIASRASQQTVGHSIQSFFHVILRPNGACTTDHELVPMRCQRAPAWLSMALSCQEPPG